MRALGSVQPDLAITRAQLTPTNARRGESVTVSIDVANLGLANASGTTIGIYIGDPQNGGGLAQSLAVPSLLAGEVAKLAATISTMLFYETSVVVFVVADPDRTIAEACEANNRASAVLQIDGAMPMGQDPAPVITSLPPDRANAGSTFSYQVEATDADGDPIGYLILNGPAGMSFGAGGLLTWFVDVPAGTRVPVTIGVIDHNYGSDAQGFTIEVLEAGATRPPIVESFPSSAAVVGQPYVYGIEARDPDGGPLTLFLAAGPAGMVLNPTTNVITWTPTAGDVGDSVVRIVATDGEMAKVEQEWTIAVAPLSSLKPDLVLVAVDASTSSTDPQGLQRDGAVLVTVLNQGTASSKAFDLWVYEERDEQIGFTAGDVLFGTGTATGLPAGATSEVVVVVAGTALFRDNRVFAVVDPQDQIEELREDNNAYVSGRENRWIPTPSPFRATRKWQWDGAGQYGAMLLSTATVAPLRDSNGDGRVGPGDTADILISSWNGEVQLWDGKMGTRRWTIPGMSVGGSGIGTNSVADIDRDGVPEIYAWGSTRKLLCLTPDGALRWSVDPIPGRSAIHWEQPGISIADLEGDGSPELVVRDAILEPDGVIRCAFASDPSLPPSGWQPMVADLDDDGCGEIIQGPSVYRSDCSLVWSHPELGVKGYTALGQLDDDPYPEIALATPGYVQVLEHTGQVKWRQGFGGGYLGMPSVGDIDGDGKAEILVGERFTLKAWKADGTTRWINGVAGGLGGATIADLDGDGKVEVLFADGSQLFVYDGRSGSTLASFSNRNGATDTYPVVADVDGDGHVEIVVGQGDLYDFNPGGLQVFGNSNWAPGRNIWNQAQYHVSNIGDDLTVPTFEEPSWKAHNTWRGQRTIVSDPYAAPLAGSPDLTASFIRVDRSGCGAQAKYTARIGNGGEIRVAAGAKMSFLQLTLLVETRDSPSVLTGMCTKRFRHSSPVT